jgi:hypothetical protein
VVGAILMPDIKRLGENQARELLATLGVGPGMIYVDYQTRDRIPNDYDQFVPYSVVSTLPAAGDWILPGTTVVLGIRAPDPEPEQPPPAPEAQPTAPPPPDEGQPPPAPTGEAPPQEPLPLPLPPGVPVPVPSDGG